MSSAPSPRLRRALLLAAIPLALALAASLALQAWPAANLLLTCQVTADLSALGLLAGAALSALAWLGCGLWAYWLRRCARALAAEQARQDQVHQRFIHRLDHELKNPLAVLQVSLSSLQNGAPATGSAGQPLAIAQEQVARLNRLLLGLRKLADLDSYPLELEAVDLADLLGRAIAAVKSAPGREGRAVALHTQRFPWSPPPLLGDLDLLLVAFYNLIDNACKFGGSDGSVQVRIGEDGAGVLVEIADNGPGIAEADLPHVFEELYRGNGARGIEGSGLGLALVKKVVERHGGSLAVRSRPGQGTVFTMRLPAGPAR
ncbi:MAG TPA: HAMP domain-containing sensor histidine kinase [Anaerolineae bacterium]|nr:HAMP domain-containing sensor histidine kinase [Anaerolineae bacterium]